MIKFEYTEVVGVDHAIRGARNAMNSWDRIDSYWTPEHQYVIGENDLTLLKKLVKSGTDHGKFMRQIVVYVDITAPRYWLTEADTYRMGVEKNSCSTMHTIHKRPLNEDDFSAEDSCCDHYFKRTLDLLNRAREKFIETKDKKYWRTMIKMLPQSFNQRRTYMISYQALRNMYHARKNHKLTEWHDFCAWVESLPYSELITDV
jgi:hypothetical protein